MVLKHWTDISLTPKQWNQNIRLLLPLILEKIETTYPAAPRIQVVQLVPDQPNQNNDAVQKLSPNKATSDTSHSTPLEETPLGSLLNMPQHIRKILANFFTKLAAVPDSSPDDKSSVTNLRSAPSSSVHIQTLQRTATPRPQTSHVSLPRADQRSAPSNVVPKHEASRPQTPINPSNQHSGSGPSGQTFPKPPLPLQATNHRSAPRSEATSNSFNSSSSNFDQMVKAQVEAFKRKLEESRPSPIDPKKQKFNERNAPLSPIECPIRCGQRFETKSQTVQHVLADHPTSPIAMRFICTYCKTVRKSPDDNSL